MYQQWTRGPPIWDRNNTVVYRGDHPEHGFCAVKVGTVRSPTVLSKVSGLSHPNVVYPLEVFEWRKLHIEVLPYVDSPKLDKVHPALFDAKQVVVDVARGVHDLHSRGIVHMDVVAGNVFYTPATRVSRLFDFHFCTEPATLDEPVNCDVEVPPEGVVGGQVTFSYDVWQLGRLYEGLLSRQLPSETSLRDFLSAGTSDVLLRATHDDFSRRFSCAGEFLDAILKA